ncbi:MAG: trypsin-like peptidase domain-containing protein, partial [Desulfobacterales bacterium]|nr:trypsin-like peptidase domain-containing protein [Desulfobacterales bacterium]
MPADFERSIHKITSRDPGNSKFGTGFVIHRQGSAAYLLTCRHVLEDAGGPAAALAANLPVKRVISPPADLPVDLAVLEVEGLSDAPALPLAGPGRIGAGVTVSGFHEFGTRKTYHIQPIHGVLRKPGGLETRDRAERVRTWDIEIGEGDLLHPGNSGAPVIDDENGTVVAVATHRRGRGEKGSAVSIAELSEVWPDMPEGLFCRPGERRRTSPGAGLIDALMCDRILEDLGFRDYFTRTREECPNRPQFYILPGPETECHGSLVKRLLLTRLKHHIQKKLKISVRPHAVSAPLEIIGSMEIRREILKENLLKAFTPEPDPDDALADVVARLGLNRHRIIVIVHDIQASKWDRRCGALIRWYIGDYWAENAACDENAPQFLVFLNVIYPRLERLRVWERPRWRHFRKKKIEN